MNIPAAILAGGQASRFGGTTKGLLPGHGGVPILERMIRELAGAGIDEVLLVANDSLPYSPLGRPIVADRHPGIGPLAGIEAALRHFLGRYEAVLVLPCDLPNITAGEITLLVQAYALAPDRVAVAQTDDGQPHALCAVVPVAALARVTEAIREGTHSVIRVWNALGIAPVRIVDASRLVDVDMPEDLHRWQQTVAAGRTMIGPDEVLPGVSSADIFTGCRANCYVEVPPGNRPIPAEECLPFTWFVAAGWMYL